MALAFVAFTDKECAGFRVQNEPPSPGTFRVDHCANCDAALDLANPSLFCDNGCRDQPKLVRYLRNGIEMGKFLPVALRYGIIRDENEAKAVYSKLRFALAGGYSRSTSRTERAAVIERDQGRCRRCGAPGAEVDHIAGSDGAMTNRQLLCTNCHNDKTLSGTPEIRWLQRSGRERSWSNVLRERIRRRPEARSLIQTRVLTAAPVRWCDTSQWNTVCNDLKSQRYARLKQSLAVLFDGEVPKFAPHTPWETKVAEARDYHSSFYDEVPCSHHDCPECVRRSFADGALLGASADSFGSVESWLDDPDVHAGYGEGSYFAEAMARDD